MYLCMYVYSHFEPKKINIVPKKEEKNNIRVIKI